MAGGAGAEVIILDIKIDDSVDLGGMISIKVDLRDVAATIDAVRQTAEDRAHILVNAAGINPVSYVDSCTVDEWDRVQEVNLRSCFFLSQAVVPAIRARKGGSIVFVSSCTVPCLGQSILDYRNRLRGRWRVFVYMKTLTVQEIMEYAIKIEQESLRFYQFAEALIADDHALEVLHILKGEEMNHVNWLQDLIQKPITSSLEIQKVATVEDDALNSVITTEQITAEATKHEILSRAFEREKKTRDLYGRMVEMATMSLLVRDTFQALRDQEQEHVLRVQALISESEQA